MSYFSDTKEAIEFWIEKLDKVANDGHYEKFQQAIKGHIGVGPEYEWSFKVVKIDSYDCLPGRFVLSDFLHLYYAVDNVSSSYARWRISKDSWPRMSGISDSNGRYLVQFDRGVRYIFQIPVELVAEDDVVELIGDSVRAILVRREKGEYDE
jgi:hypothetical protein